MAFNINPAPAAASNQANDAWKAQAFMNFFVKRPDGSKMKIGAIALKTDRKVDKALIERLSQEGGVEALQSVLEIDFQLADNGKAIELGF